jgi:hypothetical protein
LHQLQKSTSEEDRATIRKKRDQHLKLQEAQRDYFEFAVTTAHNEAENFLCLLLDGTTLEPFPNWVRLLVHL